MQTNQSIQVKFWGVRGSYPTPGPDTVRIGGNTPCVEIRAGDQVILLDAGTGIIAQGRDLVRRSQQNRVSIEATLLFSHTHHDHTQGFPFFTPAFVPSTRLYIFGPHTFMHELDQVLSQSMIPPVFPVTLLDMSASKEIRSLNESQVLLLPGAGRPPELLPAGADISRRVDPDAVVVRMLRSYAHPGGVLIYRIEWRDQVVVYATDTEGYANTDRRLADFAQGADLLIHDAQYTEGHYLGTEPCRRSTQGWGHSTPRMACDVALAAGVKRLALFHFEPTYSDEVIESIEAETQRYFPGAFAAREGLKITLGEEAPVDGASSPAADQSCPEAQPHVDEQPPVTLSYNQPIYPPFTLAC